MTRSAFVALADELLGQLDAEELDERRHAALLGRRRRRSRPGRSRAPESRAAGSAGGGSRRSRRARRRGSRAPSASRARDRLDVDAGVLDPRVRVGGEVGVLGEDLAGRHERRQLGEPAAGADADVERVEALHRLELSARQEALAERRLAEVDHAELKRGSAATAASRTDAPLLVVRGPAQSREARRTLAGNPVGPPWRSRRTAEES